MVQLDLYGKPLPENTEEFNPNDNTKKVTRYYANDLGDIIKETSKIAVEHRLVNKNIAGRRHWKKFGSAAKHPPGPNPSTTFLSDAVEIQLIQQKTVDDQEDNIELNAKKTASAHMVCRICKGDHLSYKCPNKNEMESLRELQSKLQGSLTMNETEQPTSSNTGIYISPAMRDAGAGGVHLGEKRRNEGFTVRVTNLPEETNEEDLKNLCSKFGRVTRIFPAKDKITNLNRGFAFITYATEDEAVAAIKGLDYYKYSHLILSANWAKPSNNS